MLHRVFGRAGYGKTEYMLTCLKEMQSMGMDCLFLVPEQQSLTAELAIEKAGLADFNTEVLNFERLPNRVFREIGGISADSVDSAGSLLLVATAMANLKGKLSLFTGIGKDGVGELYATIGALKRLLITPERLAEIADEAKAKRAEDGTVAKLKDVALIYAEYQRLLGDSRLDDNDPLTRLACAEGVEEFFRGKAVFLDGLYTYTPQQYKVIEIMGKNAAELFVSFTVEEDESGMFDGTADCSRRIKELCGGKCHDKHLTCNHRVKSPALAYGEENLWSGGEPYKGNCDEIEAVSCESRQDEALYAAGVVFSLIEKGLRFSEIAVAVRNPSSYEGVIDTVFATYGIPFYFASKDSAALSPLSAAVLSIFEMADSRLSLTSVKKYLKTTFSVINDEEADMLIRYAESWGIKGKSWIGDKDWLYNPKGYKAEFSDDEAETLARVNSARRDFAMSVGAVVEELCSKDLTAEKAVKLLYAHLEECGVKDKLALAAERLMDMGDADGGAKTAALWGVIVDALDRLYTLCGNRKTTAGEMHLLLEAVLANTSVGAVPSYTDAVNVGDARLMRADGVKAMIILGVNEGEFPSLPAKSGVFTLKDSAFLEDEGVSLLPSIDKAVNEERFFFYNCASEPSHYLFISHVADGVSRRSPLFATLCAMFGKGEGKSFGKDDRDYMFCRKAALSALPYLKNPALKEALKLYLAKDSRIAELLNAPPLQDKNGETGKETVEVSYLSYSKVDTYNNCGFAYLLNYKMHLKDSAGIKFNAMDSGTFLHHLMEVYLKKRMESGTYVSADREETKAEIAAISKEYIKKIMPEKPKKRLEKLLDRLQNAAVFMCMDINEEFSESAFEPRGFEVKIGNGGIAPPKLITSGGIDVRLTGSIDRLDSAVIDGKRYVRVVDYKSSGHNVTVEDAKYGEGIQMLSYLYAYCDGAEEKAFPAGVLYRAFGLPDARGKLPSQKGMILDDDEVVSAMGSRVKNLKSKLTEETVSQLKETVYSHIKETADCIAAGKMNVKTFKKREMECDYCIYGQVCRMKKPPKFNY